MLLPSDPAVTAVPVTECGEELVDLRHWDELRVDSRKQDTEGAWARVRESVADRLLYAQRSLPTGTRLLVVEGYRPAALQRTYFDRYQSELRRAHPSWPMDRIAVEASKFVSPPGVATHPCGAAVDLTLYADGRELDLGTPVNAKPSESANACFTAATNVTTETQHWRRVLGSALSMAGLVNYPSEWWHWSYGDRYWAVSTQSPAARYGPVKIVPHQ